MNKNDAASAKRWTAAELQKLPPAERDAILEEAAALAEREYRKNPELTAFEAFGKDDISGTAESPPEHFHFEDGDADTSDGGGA